MNTHAKAKIVFSLLFIFAICFSDLIDAASKGDSSENATNKASSSKKNPSKLKGILIVIYILAVILAGVFMYYFFMCYPILCRKERNYDVVEHSRDTTPTPNIDKSAIV